jgi:quinoprotein relay system zinc metallohydrolase 2
MGMRGLLPLLVLPALLASPGGPLPAAAGERALPVRQLATGLFLYQGLHEEATAANDGAIANAGFIVGKRCVAVVDTGGSLANGRRLRLAIREKTSLPVCYVINTHVHPDHIFGNAAFAPDAPAYIGHAHLAAAMLARAGAYRRLLQRQLGEAAATESTMMPPGTALASALEVDLGDRVLQLRAWPTAHTDSDVTVFDRQSGTLWLGDLLFVDHIPVLDGSLRGFLAAIETLRVQPAARVIAGHGRAGAWPQAIDAEERYLRSLQADVRAAIRQGRSLSQALAATAGPVDPGWRLVDAFHRRNVTAAYAELEWSE